MAGYLIYHPKRREHTFDGVKVYFDDLSHNQDPYLWNRCFLHTACHITQMKPEIGQTNFWISGGGPALRSTDQLVCDLVFVVAEQLAWADRNHLDRSDPLVDSDEAFVDHYGWYGPREHRWKTRTRHTLKADPHQSFQPQRADGSLVDIVPALELAGIGLNQLRVEMRAGYQTRPFLLNHQQVRTLYGWIDDHAEVKLRGAELQRIRLVNADFFTGH